MKALYRHEVAGEAVSELIDELRQLLATDGDAGDYAVHLVTLFDLNREEIDQVIGEALDRWTLSRVAQTDRAVLRLAGTELLFCPGVPFKVVIDEAIELARRYGTEASGRFVNGVLDAVARRTREAPAAGA